MLPSLPALWICLSFRIQIKGLQPQANTSSRSESPRWENLRLAQVSSHVVLPSCASPRWGGHGASLALAPPQLFWDKTPVGTDGLKAWGSGNGGPLHCPKMKNKAALL